MCALRDVQASCAAFAYCSAKHILLSMERIHQTLQLKAAAATIIMSSRTIADAAQITQRQPNHCFSNVQSWPHHIQPDELANQPEKPSRKMDQILLSSVLSTIALCWIGTPRHVQLPAIIIGLCPQCSPTIRCMLVPRVFCKHARDAGYSNQYQMQTCIQSAG